ncbi:protein of unknown function [Burkholderia multivorans]
MIYLITLDRRSGRRQGMSDQGNLLPRYKITDSRMRAEVARGV